MPLATACTFSISGENFPLIAAWVFAAKIRFCEALGPAPQSTNYFTKPEAVASFGSVLVTIVTAYSMTLSATGIRRINC